MHYNLISILLIFNIIFSDSKIEKYLWPTDASETITTVFGDKRSRRFHAGIDVRTYSIIYELLDDVSEAVIGQMTIKTEEVVIGMVDVKTTFRAPKVGVVAGSIVSEGKVELNAKARLLRQGVVIYEGNIVSLRRFKDNVEVVNEGLECGIGLSDYKDIKEGDTIEILGEVEV